MPKLDMLPPEMLLSLNNFMLFKLRDLKKCSSRAILYNALVGLKLFLFFIFIITVDYCLVSIEKKSKFIFYQICLCNLSFTLFTEFFGGTCPHAEKSAQMPQKVHQKRKRKLIG